MSFFYNLFQLKLKIIITTLGTYFNFNFHFFFFFESSKTSKSINSIKCNKILILHGVIRKSLTY